MSSPEPYEWEALLSVARTTRDELAIMKLLSTLARAQDNRDREAYLSCFTDTVYLARSAVLGDGHTGEIAATELADLYFAEMDKYVTGQHLVSNHIIDVRGDEASCSADLHAVAITSDGEQTRATFLLGRYDLRLCRTDRRWLICERSVTQRAHGTYLVEGGVS